MDELSLEDSPNNWVKRGAKGLSIPAMYKIIKLKVKSNKIKNGQYVNNLNSAPMNTLIAFNVLFNDDFKIGQNTTTLNGMTIRTQPFDRLLWRGVEAKIKKTYSTEIMQVDTTQPFVSHNSSYKPYLYQPYYVYNKLFKIGVMCSLSYKEFVESDIKDMILPTIHMTMKKLQDRVFLFISQPGIYSKIKKNVKSGNVQSFNKIYISDEIWVPAEAKTWNIYYCERLVYKNGKKTHIIRQFIDSWTDTFTQEYTTN